MVSLTDNLALRKPAYKEVADIAVINANMDRIDKAYGALSSSVAGKMGKPTELTLALTPLGWKDNKQTVTNPVLRKALSTISIWTETDWLEGWRSNVQLIEVGDGYAIFSCETVPTENITMKLMQFEGKQ